MENLPERNDIRLDCDDLIVLVGGYDGRSWSSSLDCYSPSLNQIKQLQPMTSARNFAPVSVLDGQLYVFGGGTSSMWHDTGIKCNVLYKVLYEFLGFTNIFWGSFDSFAGLTSFFRK